MCKLRHDKRLYPPIFKMEDLKFVTKFIIHKETNFIVPIHNCNRNEVPESVINLHQQTILMGVCLFGLLSKLDCLFLNGADEWVYHAKPLAADLRYVGCSHPHICVS